MQDLELAAAHWLRYEQQCVLISLERGGLQWSARPDVFGVTRQRLTIEVEVKRTVSDFRANARKRSVVLRDKLTEIWPAYFYFLAPPHVAEKVLPEVPEWAGLLTFDARWSQALWPAELVPLKRADRNHDAKPLNLIRLAKMSQAQAGTIVGLLKRVLYFQSQTSGDDYQEYTI